MEQEHKITFASGGLTVEKISPHTYMTISSGCANALELINPLPVSSMQQRKELTLFRWLNQTKTKPGARSPTSILEKLMDFSHLR